MERNTQHEPAQDAPADEPGNALTVAQQVEQALNVTTNRARLQAMAAESVRITAITSPAGYDECHAARMKLKNQRIAISKIGKDARDDAVKFQKAVISAEAELIGLIEPEEKRLAALQDAEDRKRADAKAEEERRRREAQEAIQARFNALNALPAQAIGKSIEQIDALIAEAEAFDADCLPEDIQAGGKFQRQMVVNGLKAARDQRRADIEREAQAERDRAELEQLRAERARQEQERFVAEEDARFRRELAEREQREQAERDRLAAEQAERDRLAEQERQLQADREKLAAERAEQDQQRAEQQAREDAERAEQRRKDEEAAEIERARIAAEKAALEAQRLEQAKREREHAIAGATLHAAAQEALALLRELRQGEHLVTLKLAAALSRETVGA